MIVGEGEEERASGVKLNPMHQQVEPAQPQTQAMSHSLSPRLYSPNSATAHFSLCSICLEKQRSYRSTTLHPHPVVSFPNLR